MSHPTNSWPALPLADLAEVENMEECLAYKQSIVLSNHLVCASGLLYLGGVCFLYREVCVYRGSILHTLNWPFCVFLQDLDVT